MRVTALASVVVLGSLSGPFSGNCQQTTPPASETITVRLSNFAFEPNRLRLKAGVPVRLRLVNESGGGHDFSAPAFFAASTFPRDFSAPPGGEVAVASHQTVEIAVVPRTPGSYRFVCTHFLHSFFGMHGTINVTP